ncbi:MAG: DUF456 domain-containing protein [Nocardioidaceae bacterium]
MTLTDVLVAVAILVGLVGIVVPVLPGSVLVLAAVLAWAVAQGTPAGWLVFAVAAAFLAAGAVGKYTLPGRRLRAGGVPRRTVVVGGLFGIVGFFVVPLVGLFLGFVLGVYLTELQRVGSGAACPSTRAALRAAGLSVLLELAAALLAAGTWLTGAILL